MKLSSDLFVQHQRKIFSRKQSNCLFKTILNILTLSQLRIQYLRCFTFIYTYYRKLNLSVLASQYLSLPNFNIRIKKCCPSTIQCQYFSPCVNVYFPVLNFIFFGNDRERVTHTKIYYPAPDLILNSIIAIAFSSASRFFWQQSSPCCLGGTGSSLLA